MTNKPKIIIIGGPTAVGKSALAVNLAEKFNGEIVSADSMQIYKNLDVGTAKPSAEERQGIPHYLLDFLSPETPYSVADFTAAADPLLQASREINDILDKNKLPIVVGGTALYLNALINGMNFSDADRSDKVRDKWKKIASESGNQFVYDHLIEIDPESAAKISVNDTKRIIRAIEIFEVTGKPKSQSATTAICPYDYAFFIMTRERTELYAAIETRVDKMFEDGLINEVKSLETYKNYQSMQAIGYKQLCEYFDSKFDSIESVKNEIKKLSRNYAKRQMTFFRGMNANKNFIDYLNATTEVSKAVTEFLAY